MVINIRNIISLLILFIITITPIFTINDLLLQQSIISTPTPWYIKVIKDMVIFVIIFLILISIQKRLKISQFELIIIFYIIILTVYSIVFFNSLYMYFSGLRWLLPILLVPFLIKYITRDFIQKVAFIFSILFLLLLIFQVVELFTVGYYGNRLFGLIANRTSGFFKYPTAAGFFIIMTFFLVYFYAKKSKLRSYILVLIPLSLFMANSQTANVTYVISLVCIFFYNKIKIIVMGFPFLMSLLLGLVYYFNPASVQKSLFTRFEFLYTNFFNGTLLGSFGQSTSVYKNIYGRFHLETQYLPIMSDSFVSSLVVNLGFVGFFSLISIFIFFFYLSIKTVNKEFTIFLTIYGLFAITMIFTEVFPANLVFSILLAYYLGQYRVHNYKIKRVKHEDNTCY